MELTREMLLERKAALEADSVELQNVQRQAEVDLIANHGALQQIEWDLTQLDAAEPDDVLAPEEPVE